MQVKVFCFGGKQESSSPRDCVESFLRSLRFKGHRERSNTRLAACPTLWEPTHAPRVKYQLFSWAAFHSLSWGGWFMLEILASNCQDKPARARK